MNDRLSQKPSLRAGTLKLAMVIAPLVAGTAGMYMWFIPNADLKLPAAVIGGSYVLLIVLLNSVVGGVDPPPDLRSIVISCGISAIDPKRT